MPKKDYKRKSSKALTKSRKVLQDPSIEKSVQQINHSTLYSNKLKKKS